MRKLFVIVFALTVAVPAFSQTPTPKKKFNLGNRAGDHFMIQLAQNSWTGSPDSINSHTSGFNRSANVYLMLDKPFKGDPRFSAAIGLGVSTSNIYFKKMVFDIGATTPVLAFQAADSLDHYKKFKLSTAYLEIPVEFRFTADPETPLKSVKAAVGFKVGTMLNAHTKAKNLQNAAGSTINTSTEKISNKAYFNTTRISATARVGYGAFSLFGAYSFTNLFKDGVAPQINVLQVGLTISGL